MAEPEVLAAPGTSPVQPYLDAISRYDDRFKQWVTRVEKVLSRYKDDTTNAIQTNANVKFNILWSNVQTLSAATFAKLPKADVRRRFQDQDPVGRVASMLLERAIMYELEQYPDYSATLRQCILDRFLGGRGTAWARYEPHMRALAPLPPQAEKPGGVPKMPVDGLQISDDKDEPQEELDYECAPVDYVLWRDFGHDVARTWEEVNKVWRLVYMDRAGATERFGEEMAARLSYDADPDKDPKTYTGSHGRPETAKVYEIWDKAKKKALWVSKGVSEPLDERDDPLGLQGFFPCPKPLYATLTSESLIPLPDFTLYQDQAMELDLLANTIDILVKAVKIRGTYDASIPALGRLFDEDNNGGLVPVENWYQFAEKGGLKGALDIMEVEPIASCLQYCYTAMEQIKGQVYEITGISDIIRGQTSASETATAQQLKGQYASLRLKSYQDEIAKFATDLLRLKAQIICGKFAPETIAKMASADQFPEVDKQYLEPAMQLLLGERATNPDATTPNPLGIFRIDVAADSMVYLDEQEEKDNRMEFLTAAGQFWSQAVPIVQAMPETMPLMLSLLKFGASGFKVARPLEGEIDAMAQQLTQKMQQAAQQPPPEDPKLEVAKFQAQTDAQIIPIKAQSEAARAQADTVRAQADQQIAQFDVQKAAIEAVARAQAPNEQPPGVA